MIEEFFSPEEAMPVDQRTRYYNRKVREVVRFAYENAPAVRDRLDKAGVTPAQIRTVKNLELIPFISREEIIELQKENPPYGGLLAMPVPSLYKIIYSPGPIYVPLATIDYCTAARKILFALGLRRGST